VHLLVKGNLRYQDARYDKNYCLSCCDRHTHTTLHRTILAFLIPCYPTWGGAKLGDKKNTSHSRRGPEILCLVIYLWKLCTYIKTF